MHIVCYRRTQSVAAVHCCQAVWQVVWLQHDTWTLHARGWSQRRVSVKFKHTLISHHHHHQSWTSCSHLYQVRVLQSCFQVSNWLWLFTITSFVNMDYPSSPSTPKASPSKPMTCPWWSRWCQSVKVECHYITCPNSHTVPNQDLLERGRQNELWWWSEERFTKITCICSTLCVNAELQLNTTVSLAVGCMAQW